jgi:hypothetical protein
VRVSEACDASLVEFGVNLFRFLALRSWSLRERHLD